MALRQAAQGQDHALLDAAARLFPAPADNPDPPPRANDADPAP
jgi:hypothetical protein